MNNILNFKLFHKTRLSNNFKSFLGQVVVFDLFRLIYLAIMIFSLTALASYVFATTDGRIIEGPFGYQYLKHDFFKFDILLIFSKYFLSIGLVSAFFFYFGFLVFYHCLVCFLYLTTRIKQLYLIPQIILSTVIILILGAKFTIN